ncbi:MAG: hypothetical protein LBL90_01510 [Prevotellaceae bacterium]|jgi:hypothetical protein|nr:hypothetical protein [Prevotellaceae bacterium]
MAKGLNCPQEVGHKTNKLCQTNASAAVAALIENEKGKLIFTRRKMALQKIYSTWRAVLLTWEECRIRR